MAPTFRVPRAASVALVIAGLLLAAAPVPAHGHPHLPAYFSPPTEGMQVKIGSGYPYDVTFGSAEQRLVGHHEWREVAPVGFSTNGAEPFVFEYLDLVTGQYMGAGYDDSFAYNSTLLWQDLVLWEHEMTIESSFGTAGGTLGVLPESLLWGRHLWPGDEWEVPVPDGPHGQSTTEVSVDGGWEGSVVVTVSSIYRGAGFAYAAEWTLEAPTEADVSFAAERNLRVGDVAEDGSITWYHEASIPVQVLEPGNATLAFQGLSHVAVVADRDQSLDYGPVGMFPFDPDPHPLFDVGEAGAIAWALDDQDLRVFRSRAVDPYLASAYLSVGSTGVHWRLSFVEQGRNAIEVTLDGLKVEGAPLVLIEWEAQPGIIYGDPIDAATRGAMEVAAVGQLAVLAQEAGESLEQPARRFTWDLSSWGAGFTEARFEIDFQPRLSSGVLPVDWWSVGSDARTAIVSDTRNVADDVSLAVGPQLPSP